MAKLQRKTVREPEPAENEIEVRDVGPVERLRFTLPENGGLVVLSGDNGAGKSTTLNAVGAALGQKNRLSKRDNTAGGSVKACGITIRVGEQMRRAGELTVASLEDRLSIADLVDPGIADPAAADRRRLKALLTIRGDSTDADSWYDLLPGGEAEFKAIIPPEVIEETDLVVQAEGIKRAIEAKAREAEDAADNARRDAAAKREAAADVDVSQSDDDADLQAQLEAAIKAESVIRLKIDSAAAAKTERAEAEPKLAQAVAAYKGPTAAHAREELSRVQQAKSNADEQVARLERELESAKNLASQLARDVESATTVLQSAEAHEQLVASCQEILQAAEPKNVPTDADLEAAKQRTAEIRQAIANVGIVKRAKGQLAEAEELDATAKQHTDRATQLREAARGTDQILTDLIRDSGGDFIIGEDDKGRMRICVDHPQRGVIPFSECSPGEKWGYALPVAIAAVGPGGMFTIPQEAFEALSPRNRQRIIDRLVGSGVTAITALPADGDLRVDVLGAAG